ncbi:MAG TPA: sigma-70 family RNA polymerase sigma factor [Pyrinomonadaceae bacterium]|jgi:RNA polymerase sigma-70 factor (ECF subfamily)|nr:sigma-70 family RNA polymerase sigma factor [Pyrinomonadaceae bacterium]
MEALSGTLTVGEPRGAHAEKPLMNSPEQLVALARRGDHDAFRHIFDRWARPVVSFVYDMVGDRALAEDLTQETFVRAYKYLDALRDETKFSTWLFSIAKNVAREHLRSAHSRSRKVDLDDETVLELQDERPTPAGALLDKELNGVVRHALGALDEDKRMVFTLKIFQQRSYEEIAEITGFSVPKVKTDLHRARTEMRKRMSPYLGVKQ